MDFSFDFFSIFLLAFQLYEAYCSKASISRNSPKVSF